MIVIHFVKMNLDATTILSPRIAYVDTVTYFKIVQALTKHWLNLNQIKLDVLYMDKTIKIFVEKAGIRFSILKSAKQFSVENSPLLHSTNRVMLEG